MNHDMAVLLEQECLNLKNKGRDALLSSQRRNKMAKSLLECREKFPHLSYLLDCLPHADDPFQRAKYLAAQCQTVAAAMLLDETDHLLHMGDDARMAFLDNIEENCFEFPALCAEFASRPDAKAAFAAHFMAHLGLPDRRCYVVVTPAEEGKGTAVYPGQTFTYPEAMQRVGYCLKTLNTPAVVLRVSAHEAMRWDTALDLGFVIEEDAL
jgi:hypothetical protein